MMIGGSDEDGDTEKRHDTDRERSSRKKESQREREGRGKKRTQTRTSKQCGVLDKCVQLHRALSVSPTHSLSFSLSLSLCVYDVFMHERSTDFWWREPPLAMKFDAFHVDFMCDVSTRCWWRDVWGPPCEWCGASFLPHIPPLFLLCVGTQQAQTHTRVYLSLPLTHCLSCRFAPVLVSLLSAVCIGFSLAVSFCPLWRQLLAPADTYTRVSTHVLGYSLSLSLSHAHTCLHMYVWIFSPPTTHSHKKREREDTLRTDRHG